MINNKVGFHETFEQLCFLDKYRIAENIYLSVLIDIQKHWLMQAQTFFIKVQSLTNSVLYFRTFNIFIKKVPGKKV